MDLDFALRTVEAFKSLKELWFSSLEFILVFIEYCPSLEYLHPYLCEDGKKQTYCKKAYEVEIVSLRDWLDMEWNVTRYNIHSI